MRVLLKKLFYILSFLIITIDCEAQEMWGISNSNYAGSMGMNLNPATMVGAHYRWEAHLLSSDLFVMNNYLYVKKNSDLIKKSMRGESVPEERFTDNYNTKHKFGNGSLFVKYPGFIYSGNKIAVGFHASTRVAFSVRGMPFHLAKFMKEGFDYTPQQDINYTGSNTDVVGINWHEAGISIGTVLKDDKTSYITGAITLNYLSGLNSFYMRIADIDYIVPNDWLWQINNVNAEYGHALADAGDNAVNNALSQKGNGYSTTIGFQYYHNRNENAYLPCTKDARDKKYDYKIGFSLIDLGKINFSKQAEKYEFINQSTYWY